jgi:hypothetical protein
MKDNGLEPNVQTFNMMLFSSFTVKDRQMVKQLLEEMIDSRIKLSYRNSVNMCKLRCCLNLLPEITDLGLLSAKALDALSHAESVKANYKHCTEVDIEGNLVLDSSSSEDMSDEAASVC